MVILLEGAGEPEIVVAVVVEVVAVVVAARDARAVAAAHGSPR